jgi:hypothetical protein
MLSSIHPLGERARGNRWGVTVALFTAAAGIGGALVGGVAGALGAFVVDDGDRWNLVLLALLAGAAFAVDATGRNGALARPRRQVDETWLTVYRRWVYAGGWGLQLGAGVLTVMPAATVWLVPAGAALTGSPQAGAAVGAVFGLTRGLSLLAPARVQDPPALLAFHAAMAARARDAHRLATATDALVALAVLAALLVRP